MESRIGRKSFPISVREYLNAIGDAVTEMVSKKFGKQMDKNFGDSKIRSAVNIPDGFNPMLFYPMM